MKKIKATTVFQFSEEDVAAIARAYNLVLDIQHEMKTDSRLQSNIPSDGNWLDSEELAETEAGLYWLATRLKLNDTIFVQEGHGE